MRTNLIFFFLLLATGIFAQGTGEVIITELHIKPLKPSQAQLNAALPNNPSGANTTPNEGHTEWFEVYNTTNIPVVMDGWTITDASSTSNVTTIGSFTLGAFSYAAFSGFNIPAAQGGVVFDYFYDYKKPSFNNRSSYKDNGDTSCPDGVILQKANGTLVDEVRYDFNFGNYIGNPNSSSSCSNNAAPIGLPADGLTVDQPSKTSIMLNFDPAIMNAADNDIGTNWSYSTIEYDDDGNQKGTPGLANDGSLPPEAPAQVPTLGEWGLMILFLIMISMTLLLQMAPKLVTSNGQTVYTGINFREIPFDKTSFFKAWAKIGLFVLAIFTIAIVFFSYELTSADPVGSLIASAILAYIFTLLKSGKDS